MKPEQERVLDLEAIARREQLILKRPELKNELRRAYGYAVFPSLGRAGLVLGGSYGHGVVFEDGEPIGYATLSQITLGVQVGGQTYAEIIFFEDADAMEGFKGGKVAFAANASAVLVKAGASGTIDYANCTAHAYSRGGMLLEGSLGGQKFNFVPPSSERNEAAEKNGKLKRHPQNGKKERAPAGNGKPEEERAASGKLRWLRGGNGKPEREREENGKPERQRGGRGKLAWLHAAHGQPKREGSENGGPERRRAANGERDTRRNGEHRSPASAIALAAGVSALGSVVARLAKVQAARQAERPRPQSMAERTGEPQATRT